MNILRLSSFLFVSAIAACGSNDIGDSCDKEGSTDDCVDNAVCQKNKAGAIVCAKLCTDKNQCSSNLDCEGVSGSNLKACR